MALLLNGLGIESSHLTICGAKPCLTSLIPWSTVYSRWYRFKLQKTKRPCVRVLVGQCPSNEMLLGPGQYGGLCQGCSQGRLGNFPGDPDQVMPLAGLQKGGLTLLHSTAGQCGCLTVVTGPRERDYSTLQESRNVGKNCPSLSHHAIAIKKKYILDL